MKQSERYSPEVCECAARLVSEVRAKHVAQWRSIENIALKIGVVRKRYIIEFCAMSVIPPAWWYQSAHNCFLKALET